MLFSNNDVLYKVEKKAPKSEKTFLIIAIQAVAMVSACLEKTRAVPFGDGK